MRMLAALATILAVASGIAPASAQAVLSARTWVSGSGSDANSCSRTLPCQTFAGAISRTAAGGEINCLDSGGFGTLTINKAISIVCTAGEAGVLVSSTNGVTISAGFGDQVLIDGLDLEGLGSGLDGISILSAAEVIIKNSTIRNFSGNGITVVTPSLVRVIIRNCAISENTGSGVMVNSIPGQGHVRIFDSIINTNLGDGVRINGINNEAVISNDEILGNTNQFNTSTNVSGGKIYSLGNNTVLGPSSDTLTPFPLR